METQPSSGQAASRSVLARWRRSRSRLGAYIASGTSATFVLLFLTFVALLGLISLLRVIVLEILGAGAIERGDQPGRQLYLTFLQMTDPGNMAQDIDSSPWVKLFTILAGVVGIILLAALIAFLTTALDQTMHEFRKGFRGVLLDHHTLILGWNERIPDVLRELAIANESEVDSSIVILADRDREEMVDSLKRSQVDLRGTKVEMVPGSPTSPVDLELGAIGRCKSIIVLATCGIGSDKQQLDTSDAHVLKTLLAIASCAHWQRTPVVAELYAADTRSLAVSIDPERILAVDSNEVLAKILVQSARSAGVSDVYEELLSFDGSELYIVPASDVSSLTFGELYAHCTDGVPIGILRAGGALELNPATETRLEATDEVIVMARDDSTVAFTPDATSGSGSVVGDPSPLRELEIERELLIGWTPKAGAVIREYGSYVSAGSQIDVLPREAGDIGAELADASGSGVTASLALANGDSFTLDGLESLDLTAYESVIVLSQSGDFGGEEATDSETLLILLQLRRLLAEANGRSPRVIAEILDSRNAPLMAQSGAKEFVISNRLVSKLVAQLSEQPLLARVYGELFEPAGAELYIKPVELYFSTLPVSVSFVDVVATAAQRGETVIGVREASSEGHRVTLNPEKSATIHLDAGAGLIVVASDGR